MKEVPVACSVSPCRFAGRTNRLSNPSRVRTNPIVFNRLNQAQQASSSHRCQPTSKASTVQKSNPPEVLCPAMHDPCALQIAPEQSNSAQTTSIQISRQRSRQLQPLPATRPRSGSPQVTPHHIMVHPTQLGYSCFTITSTRWTCRTRRLFAGRSPAS